MSEQPGPPHQGPHQGPLQPTVGATFCYSIDPRHTPYRRWKKLYRHRTTEVFLASLPPSPSRSFLFPPLLGTDPVPSRTAHPKPQARPAAGADRSQKGGIAGVDWMEMAVCPASPKGDCDESQLLRRPLCPAALSFRLDHTWGVRSCGQSCSDCRKQFSLVGAESCLFEATLGTMPSSTSTKAQQGIRFSQPYLEHDSYT